MNPGRPDSIPGTVVKACADQLAGILIRLFKLSMTHATVPTCLKASAIISMPKKTDIDRLMDYRLIALTSVDYNIYIVWDCFGTSGQ